MPWEDLIGVFLVFCLVFRKKTHYIDFITFICYLVLQKLIIRHELILQINLSALKGQADEKQLLSYESTRLADYEKEHGVFWNFLEVKFREN